MKSLLCTIVATGLLCGCGPRVEPINKQEIMKKEGFINSHAGYGIALPKGWKEVKDENAVKQRVFWAFRIGGTPYYRPNYFEEPAINAYDSPKEQETILTTLTYREEGKSFSHWSQEIMEMMKSLNITVQEKGWTSISGNHAKWWVNSIGNNAFQQMCYMTMHNDILYIFYFTTPHLTKEKMQFYNEIIKNIVL